MEPLVEWNVYFVLLAVIVVALLVTAGLLIARFKRRAADSAHGVNGTDPSPQD